MTAPHTAEIDCACGRRPESLPRLALYAVCALFAFGALLRLRLYLFNPALWLDEANVALDLVRYHSPAVQMQFGHTRICPLAWILLMDAATWLFGTGEHALRLVPLLAGLAGFLPFYFLARRSLGAWGVVAAVALMAATPKAAGFATQVKAYSMDVAVSAAMAYLGVLALHRQLDLKWGVLLAAAGAAAVWSSFPAVFVLAGMGLVLWAFALARKQWRRALGLSAVGLVWVLSGGAYYVLSLHGASSAPKLQDYWQSSYMPAPTSAAALAWLPDAFSSALEDVVGFRHTALAGLWILVGFAALARRCRELALLLAAPAVVALVAAALRIYPFEGRLLLFLLPFISLLAAAGMELAWTRTHGAWRLPVAFCIALAVAFPMQRSVANFVSPKGREEIRPVMAYVAEHRRAGDTLYVNRPGYEAFSYYRDRYGLEAVRAVRGRPIANTRADYGKEFGVLIGGGRTWFIFSHMRPTPRDDILSYLDTIGTRLDEVQAEGASAYLYDMGPAERRGHDISDSDRPRRGASP